jgi:hypothetical protein
MNMAGIPENKHCKLIYFGLKIGIKYFPKLLGTFLLGYKAKMKKNIR